MSRYQYLPQGWPDQYAFTIGWDNALGSYFGLVIDVSISQGEDGVIVAIGGVPPHFEDLDNLMRVVNRRIKDRLPPIELPSELRRELRKDANAETPVVNSLTWTPEGEGAPSAGRKPPIRPHTALGTTTGYLNADEVQGVMDGMADKYVRLERLYLARKAKGLTEDNDEDTKLIRRSLGEMSAVCQLLDALVRTTALVAAEALKPFQELAAAAADVLDTQSAHAAAPSETVH